MTLRISFDMVPARRYFTTCECGWKSEKYEFEIDAEDEWRKHTNQGDKGVRKD